MKTRGLISILIIILVCLYTKSNAYETVSGDVGGQIWDMGTYWVSSAAFVPIGDTLVIYSGVNVKFANAYLQINGTLIANEVVFTSEDDDTYGEILPSSDGIPNKGDWQYFNISSSNARCYATSCIFRYGGGGGTGIINISNVDTACIDDCTVEYAIMTGIGISSASTIVKNCTIRNIDYRGIMISGYNSGPIIQYNTLTNIGYYAVFINSTNTLTDYIGNTGSNNFVNGFVIGPMSFIGDWTIHKNNLPIVFNGNFLVSPGSTVNIEGGSVIKIRNYAGIDIQGSLYVNGTPSDTVVFTSINDDTYGGDTNNDGSTTTPAPGDWQGIAIYGIDAAIGNGYFDWCKIRYGGYSTGYYPLGNLHFFNPNAGYFKNSISEYSASYGIVLAESPINVRGCLIENNNNYGVYITGSSYYPNLGENDPLDQGKNRIRNNDYGVYEVVNVSSQNINAYYNYWEYETAGEIEAHIYDADDDANSGQFLFDPWLVVSIIEVDLTVLLEGPFNGIDMNTDLNDNGLLPFIQPYSDPPWNYAGTETVASIPNTNVVDWILVELHDATDAASVSLVTLVETQAAFILANGSIVGMDGVSMLEFDHAVTNNLFAIIRHRNHMDILSANALSESIGVYTYDFTLGTTQAFGTGAQKDLGSGIFGMYTGDANADGDIGSFDHSLNWSDQTGHSGYLSSDLNMDGQSNNPDKDDYWLNNNGMVGQLPY